MGKQNEENNDDFDLSLKSLIEGQREQMKLLISVVGEVSEIKNNQKDFEREIRHYLENNPKTNHKGIVQQVSENTSDIKDVKSEVKTINVRLGNFGDSISKLFKKSKEISDDVGVLKTNWRILVGKFTFYGGVAGTLGVAIWKLALFLKSL